MPPGTVTFTITFRGVRGSHPMPGPSTLRYGGNTTCQEIHVGGRLIIFDAGTGIISLGNELARQNAPHTMAMFFSHNHHDHISGLLYFKPAYMPSTTMHIFGPSDNPGSILDALETLSAPAAHPVQFAQMGMHSIIRIIASGDVVVWKKDEDSPRLLASGETSNEDDVVIKILKNHLHPVEGVLNFRMDYMGKSYVYASDVEGDAELGDPELAAFACGADLLAHDGQYTEAEYASGHAGWGHSTVEMAILTAKLAKAKRLAIIHYDPSHDDDMLDEMEEKVKEKFSNIFFAYEGQTVSI